MIKNKQTLMTITIALGSALGAATPQLIHAEEVVMLEEITVTARRRSEDLMSTPVSVSAFSADEIKARQVERIHQIAQATPNLVFRDQAAASAGNNNAVVYIRGIGQADFVPSTEPGVGIYVDEAYISQATGAVLNLVDIETVQVLRGPQGTLFGRNTIGGAVLINTVKPNEEFGAEVNLIAGSDDWYEGKLSVNTPFTDTLFSRFSLIKRERDGWIDQPNIPGSDGGGSDDTWGARIALRWVPTENLTIDLSADYTNSKSSGSPGVLGGLTSNINSQGDLTNAGEYNILVAPTLGLPAYTDANFLGLGSYTSLATQVEEGEQDIWGASLTVNWDLGWASLKSISNYRELESSDRRDDDHSPMQPINSVGDFLDSEQWSQEFQLSGQALNDKLDWTAGVYYFEDDAVNINPIDFPLFGGFSGSIVEKQSSALFVQGTYAITDKLGLTLGARYTDDEKDFIVDDRIQYVTRIWGPIIGAPAGFAFLPPNAFKLVQNGTTEADTNEKDAYVNLSYQWTEDLLVYGSYSEGFKGGGFVQRIIPGASVTSFDPEYAKVWETGFKWEGFDQRLRLTGAVFYTDYTDLQIVVERSIAPVTENAGDAELWGAEFEFIWLASRDLLLSGGIGWLDAEYTKVDPSASVTKSHELPSTPDWQFNFSAAYTLPMEVLSGSVNFRVDYSWTDEHFLEADNQILQKNDSYEVMNAAITWTSESEKWLLSLRGQNITDELYLTSPQQGIETSGFVAPTIAPDARYSLALTFRL